MLGAFFLLLLSCLSFRILGDQLLGHLAPDREEDIHYLDIWLGVGLLSTLLSLASCFLPVSWEVTLFIVGLLLCCPNPNPRPLFQAKAWFPLMIWALPASILACTPSMWGDTGLYHAPLIRWMHDFGSAYGIGLSGDALSNTINWFALWAPLNTGVFAWKTASIPSAFCFLVFMASAQRHTQNLKTAPSFHLLALIAYLGTIAALSQIPTLLSSATPDLASQAIWILVLLLIIRSRKNDLVLACMLVALFAGIRISVLPAGILPWFLLLKKQRKSALKTAVACLILLFPAGLASYKTSGCPFFPVPWLCLKTPWGVGADGARNMQNHVMDNARFMDKPIPPNPTFMDWLPYWMQQEPAGAICLLLFTVGASLLILTPKSSRITVGHAIGGGAFLLATAPAIRYGAALFLLPVALWLSQRKIPKRAQSLGIAALWFLTIGLLVRFEPTFHNRLQSTKESWLMSPGIRTHPVWLEAVRTFENEEWGKSMVFNQWLCDHSDRKDSCSDAAYCASRLQTPISSKAHANYLQEIQSLLPPVQYRIAPLNWWMPPLYDRFPHQPLPRKAYRGFTGRVMNETLSHLGNSCQFGPVPCGHDVHLRIIELKENRIADGFVWHVPEDPEIKKRPEGRFQSLPLNGFPDASQARVFAPLESAP